MNPLKIVNLLEIAILVTLPALFWGSHILLCRLGSSAPKEQPDPEEG